MISNFIADFHEPTDDDVDTKVLEIFGEERVHKSAYLMHVDKEAEAAKEGANGNSGEHEAHVEGVDLMAGM